MTATMKGDVRPMMGDHLVVTFRGQKLVRPVAHVYGQFVFVDGHRFHTLDDRVASDEWALPGVRFKAASLEEVEGEG